MQPLADDAPEDLKQLVRDWPLGLRFDLEPDSVIVVVGAYTGKVMDLMSRVYPDYWWIVGYEPQLWAVEAAKERLVRTRDIKIMPYGLGPITILQAPMGEWHTDACSFLNPGPDSRLQGFGDIVEANHGLQKAAIFQISLMVMNIEGGELALLPHLDTTGWLEKIDRMAIQWHPGEHYDSGQMPLMIDWIQTKGFDLVHDERPTWTYYIRRKK